MILDQKDANNRLLFIEWIFGLQDHNLYLLDCLFLVVNIFFTSTMTMPKPKLQAKQIYDV